MLATHPLRFNDACAADALSLFVCTSVLLFLCCTEMQRHPLTVTVSRKISDYAQTHLAFELTVVFKFGADL